MGNFFAELKRRHVYRVAAAYVVVAWLILQVVNNVAPGLNLANSVVTLVIVLLSAGFPIALIFAWIFDIKATGPADGLAPKAKTTGLDWMLVSALVAVIGIFVYQQITPVGQTAQQASIVPAPIQSAGVSLAVLPFANLSGDAAQEFFSDGMTEEITAALAKVQSLRVVARSSAFQFKGEKKDMRAVGQALGARYLIDGSVRKEGTRVRITAQLIEAANGVNIWTDSYDRELAGVFTTQEDIAKAIAGALRVPLGLQQGESLISSRTTDIDSYQEYLRARALFRARAIDRAIATLDSVIARDPDFAPARALLAEVYVVLPAYDVRFVAGPIAEARNAIQSVYEKAAIAAQEAIRLDPRHVAGYTALAYVEAGRGNWSAADDLFRQALAVDPNDPDTLHLHSLILAGSGRFRQALSVREQLRALEPFVPVYNIFTAEIMEFMGQNQAAAALLEATPMAGAVSYYRNVWLASAYASEGRFTDAADTLLATPRGQTSVNRRSIEEAARLLRSAPAKMTAPDALPVLEGDLDFVYIYVGAPERVFEAPERFIQLGLAGGGATIIASMWFASYAPLRKTERFKSYLRAIRLPEFWRARGWPDLCRPVGADDFECD